MVFSKFQDLVETTVDLTQVQNLEFVIRADFDDRLLGNLFSTFYISDAKWRRGRALGQDNFMNIRLINGEMSPDLQQIVQNNRAQIKQEINIKYEYF